LSIGAAAELDAGVLAFLGAVVTTVVFTIGFVSHRSHSALIDATERLRRPPGEQSARENAEHARDTVERAQSYLALAVNLILVVLAIVAARIAWPEDSRPEDQVTLVGFCVLMVLVLLLGYHDHIRVRNSCNDELKRANARRPDGGVGLLKPAHKAAWAELTGGERRLPAQRR
jgi:hypothetical protein